MLAFGGHIFLFMWDPSCAFWWIPGVDLDGCGWIYLINSSGSKCWLLVDPHGWSCWILVTNPSES